MEQHGGPADWQQNTPLLGGVLGYFWG